MELDCLGEKLEGVSILPGARLRNRKQPGGGDRASLASITETGLAPLHGGAQRPFRVVVGRLHAGLVEKTE